MGTQTLQAGTVPTVNSKGVRVSERPMNDDDRKRASATTLGGMAGSAEAAIRDRPKKLNDAIDGYADGGQIGTYPKKPNPMVKPFGKNANAKPT